MIKALSNALLPRFILATLLVTSCGLYAQISPKDFIAEPDTTMAVAREYFLKGETNKAIAELRKAALFLKKSSLEVVPEGKTSLEDAARALDRLAEDVRIGATKSDTDLNRVFAKVDYALATGWNRTAAQSGKGDRQEALKKASSALLGAAKWSTSKLDGSENSPLKAFDGPIPSEEMDLNPAARDVAGQSKQNTEGTAREARGQ